MGFFTGLIVTSLILILAWSVGQREQRESET